MGSKCQTTIKRRINQIKKRNDELWQKIIEIRTLTYLESDKPSYGKIDLRSEGQGRIKRDVCAYKEKLWKFAWS